MIWLLACTGGPEPVSSSPVANERPPYDGEDFRIGQGWSIVAPQEHQALARRVASSDLVPGCQDGFPRLPVVEEADGPAIELSLDPSLGAQAYRVTVEHQPARIHLVGGDPAGLHYAALGLVLSTERELDCDWPFHPPFVAAWEPTEVLDRPDNTVRMAFPAFKGEQDAHFLPNIVYAGLGRCEDPLDTAAFWEESLACDPATEPCGQVHRRLDALVLGRFSHALDEGHPFERSRSLEEETGCDGALVYEELRAWLADRHVTLVPTAFGLETRTPDTPVGGSRVPEEEPAERWGQRDGDVSLSEGLGVTRSMRVCPLDAGLFLAPDCDTLDAEGRVTGSLELARVDVDASLPGERSGQCEDLEICQVKPDCWEPTPGLDGLALRPAAACENPALRVLLPVDEQPDRLVALGFLARVPEVRDLVVKVITRGPEGVTPAQDVWPLATTDEEYLDLRQDGAERFTVITRVPNGEDEDWQQAWIQLLGVPGSGLLLDELVVEEVDGRLAALDPTSVRVEGLDPSCLEVDPGWEAPLRPAPWRRVDGSMGLPLASIRVDAACAAPGDELMLHYRSFAPAGLWPGLAVRQKAWTWTPDSQNPDFWEHPWAPRAGSELTLVSDLGGEVRGIGRDGAFPPDERLADFICRLATDDCPDGEPCDCADTPASLLVAADMFTPWHNGARGHAQVPFGGFVGHTWTARRRLPASTTYLAWWHYDALRDGLPIGGHEQMMGMVADFAADGLAVIGASAWDPDNQRAWSAAAAGGFTAGTAHYGWGSDAQGPAVMVNAGRLAWSPGVALSRVWNQEEGEDFHAQGMSLEPHTHAWPLQGAWQRIEADDATWSAQGEGDWLRLYAELPEGCELTLDDQPVPHRARWEALGAPVDGELTLRFVGCAGGVLDHVALYRTLDVVDFPTPFASEGLEQWSSEDELDPRAKICGDPQVSDCLGASWPN